ncbi:molybdopterin molybdotransferase MoeA [soil metagenome]
MSTAQLLDRPLVRLEDALARMLHGVEPLPVEQLPLVAAQGHVLAEAIDSRLTLPPWDNSAMDGFAVRATDVADATAERPVRLEVRGEAAAGRRADMAVEPGTTLRILTGAPLPAGADAVVPVEDTDAEPGSAMLPSAVEVRHAAAPGSHVRGAGSDLVAGRRLLDRGIVLGAAELAVAAAGGHGMLPVHRRPRVAVLATGDELVPAGEPLSEAQIPDSNSIGLVAQARQCGAEAASLGISGDELSGLLDRLREGIAQAEVIVVSGGVSVGARDVVKDAFAELGTLELWRVAVQPGKPLAFARAPRAGDRPPALLFGLPGNPVSSFVTFELFVRPVLRRLAGQPDPTARETLNATLSEPVTKSPGRRAFLRVRLRLDNGEWRASLAGGQASHVLSALAAADGLAVVPEEVDGLPAGARVEVILLRRTADLMARRTG